MIGDKDAWRVVWVETRHTFHYHLIAAIERFWYLDPNKVHRNGAAGNSFVGEQSRRIVSYRNERFNV